jgi:ABC-2 type transport system permease protein
MSNVWKVIRQEFKMATATRAFVIITIIGPFLIIAMAVLPSYIANRGMAKAKATVAVYGAAEPFLHDLEYASQHSNIEFISSENRKELEELTIKDEINGFVDIPGNYLESEIITYYSKTGTDVHISETLSGMIGSIIVSQRLRNEGMEPEKIFTLMKTPIIETKKIASDRKDDFFSILMTAIALVMLIYMTILLYGQMIGRAVLMEKLSKTVEIMLSSVRPWELMMGKIGGRGLAGILQYTVWISIALVVGKVVAPVLNIALPGTFTVANLGFMVLFFILAFFLYSSLWAILGAGSEDEQHMAQLGWPLIMCLVLPLMLVSLFVMSPNSTFSYVLSYFPLTAPIVMFIRILIAAPPAWEILVCVAILLITIGIVILGAAKIFRIGILMTGKKYTMREILKWIRY